nr:MAG TPA: hypothetical protein [Caudoviricetes sp.]
MQAAHNGSCVQFGHNSGQQKARPGNPGTGNKKLPERRANRLCVLKLYIHRYTVVVVPISQNFIKAAYRAEPFLLIETYRCRICTGKEVFYSDKLSSKLVGHVCSEVGQKRADALLFIVRVHSKLCDFQRRRTTLTSFIGRIKECRHPQRDKSNNTVCVGVYQHMGNTHAGLFIGKGIESQIILIMLWVLARRRADMKLPRQPREFLIKKREGKIHFLSAFRYLLTFFFASSMRSFVITAGGFASGRFFPKLYT